jgi:hypothetical protein
MNIIISIVIGFAVLIAALFFLSCSICAVSGGLSGLGRAISGLIALISFGVMIGGVYIIAHINRRQDGPE